MNMVNRSIEMKNPNTCLLYTSDYQWFSSLANVISICIELRKTKDEAVRERTFLSNLFRYMPLGYVRTVSYTHLPIWVCSGRI